MEKAYSSNIISDIFDIIGKINRERLEGKLEKSEEEIITLRNKHIYHVKPYYENNILYKIEVWKESEDHAHFNPYFVLERKDKKPGSITFEARDIKKIEEFYKLLEGLERIIN